jgi:hypothetical protein
VENEAALAMPQAHEKLDSAEKLAPRVKALRG